MRNIVGVLLMVAFQFGVSVVQAEPVDNGGPLPPFVFEEESVDPGEGLLPYEDEDAGDMPEPEFPMDISEGGMDLMTEKNDFMESLGVVDQYEFISGEIVSFDGQSGDLVVKVYLNDEGDPVNRTLKFKLDSHCEITDGENDLTVAALKPDLEVDVEYDEAQMLASYIFVYE
jgi:hypothetical protein